MIIFYLLTMITGIQALLATKPFCDYKSDLMDELRKVNVLKQNTEKKYCYTLGIHTFILNFNETLYEKDNNDNYLVFNINSRKWLGLLLTTYHESIMYIYIKDSNWLEMFSGMDISKRLFVHKHFGSHSFGDLVPDIIGERSPRYADIKYESKCERILESKEYLDSVLYVRAKNHDLLKLGLFPNFEYAYLSETKQVINSNYEIMHEMKFDPVEYLLQLPSRGIGNKK
jgi:hypothetical protein